MMELLKRLQYTFVDDDEMQFDMVFADHVFGTIFPKLQRMK